MTQIYLESICDIKFLLKRDERAKKVHKNECEYEFDLFFPFQIGKKIVTNAERQHTVCAITFKIQSRHSTE